MEEIQGIYSGIRAYERSSQGRYLQLILPAGKWACDEERRKQLSTRLDEYAFSAGQEVSFLDCSSFDDLCSKCEAVVASYNNGNWDRILISVVSSMSDADEEPEKPLLALDMAVRLKKYLDDNYAVNCSAIFYGVFTTVRKIECREFREKLAELQNSKDLQEIFHIVNTNGSEIRPLQTIAFSSAILPFCMDATDIDSPQYRFNIALNNKAGAAQTKGNYCFKLIDSLLLNVQEAAAIKYSYDILNEQQNGAVKDITWDKGLEGRVRNLLFKPLIDNGKATDDVLNEIHGSILSKTRMLPILPQESPHVGLFHKKTNLIMEAPEQINTMFYGKSNDGRSTLERFIDSELARLRGKLDEYCDDDFCEDLVYSCPRLKYARSGKFKAALKTTAEKGFDSFFKSGEVPSELEANDSQDEKLKKKSLYCRNYYITVKLNSFFAAYLKERMVRIAERLADESDGTVNGISDRLAMEMFHLREGWTEYMGTDIEKANAIVSVQQYIDPMDGIKSTEFHDKVFGMSNAQEASISADFIDRANKSLMNTPIVEAAGTSMADQLFIHNTEFSALPQVNAFDLSSKNVFYHMLAAFSVRFFSADDTIRYYKQL